MVQNSALIAPVEETPANAFVTAVTSESVFMQLTRSFSPANSDISTTSAHEKTPLTKSTGCASGTSLAGATANLITVMIGVGILAFPNLFATVGWIMAPPLLCAIAALTAEIGFITDRSLHFIDNMALSKTFSFGVQAVKFEDMGEACFDKIGKFVVGFMNNMFLLFLLAAYLILIGTNMEVFSMGTKFQMPTRAWVLVFIVFLTPTALLQDTSKIARFAFLGVLSSMMYVFTIITAGLVAANSEEAVLHPREYKDYTSDLSSIGRVCAMMLFGFMYVIVLPTVRGNMRQPSAMPQAISYSTYCSVMVYLSCGLVGYYGWGVAVKENVVHSMGLIFGKVMSGAVVLNLVVSYPILMNCVTVAVETMLGIGYSICLRHVLVLITLIVCLACPYFMAVVGLGSSVLGVIIGIFLPIVFFWRLAYLVNGHSWMATFEQEGVVPIIKHAILVAIGALTMCFGAHSSWGELMAAMEQGSANPFQDFFRYMC